MELLIRKFHLSKVSSNSLDDDANGERLVYTLYFMSELLKSKIKSLWPGPAEGTLEWGGGGGGGG